MKETLATNTEYQEREQIIWHLPTIDVIHSRNFLRRGKTGL